MLSPASTREPEPRHELGYAGNVVPKSPDDIATELEQEAEAPPAGPHLVAFWDGGSLIKALPQQGTVVLGRGLASDLRLDHASVSRQHARVHVSGTEVFLEDLRSANGVKVGGVRVEPGGRVPVAEGELVELGAVLLVLQGFEHTFGGPSGQPGAMDRTMKLAKLVALGHMNVYIAGESGVGKDYLAGFIHKSSRRSSAPLVHVHAGQVGEDAAELVGASTEGAPAGALERAHMGTLVLEQIEELPKRAQAALLVALERKRVERTGGVVSLDVRMIATSHMDPERAKTEQCIREDLIYRLAGVTLYVPPLRARQTEIAELAGTFAEHASREMGRCARPVFAPATLARLESLPWPGNVAELRAVVERAVLLSGGRRISLEHLEDAATPADGLPALDLRAHVAEAERTRIVAALARTHGNQTKAAELLGISRRTLIDRIESYGLPRPRK